MGSLPTTDPPTRLATRSRSPFRPTIRLSTEVRPPPAPARFSTASYANDPHAEEHPVGPATGGRVAPGRCFARAGDNMRRYTRRKLLTITLVSAAANGI